jgi:predicted aspartyl protease
MRFALIFVCGAIVAFSSRAANAATDPLDVFAKHAAAIGYSLADGRAKAYVLEYTTTRSDSDRTTHAVRKQAGAYFRVSSIGNGRTSGYGFDGRAFWSVDENGNVNSDIGLSRQYDVTWAIINAEGYGAGVASELLKETTDAYIIRIHPKSGVPADIFFNKTTYYVERVVVDPLGEQIQEDYVDYRRQGGIAIAMTRTFGTSTSKVTTFKWDAPIPADDVAMPVARTYAVFPLSGSAAISFDDKQDSIIFEASVNGVKGRFVLDTGASNVVFTQAFADKAHLKPLDTSSAQTIGGTAGTATASIDRLRIGDVEFQNFYGTIGAKGGFDGLIGYDVLAQVVCDVDFDKHLLTLSNPATYKDRGTRVAVIVALDGGTPQIPALINGKRTVYMDLDTGDAQSMTFTRTFIDQNPGIVARGREVRFVGAGGESQPGYMGTLDEIDIGPYKFFGLEADVLGGFRGFAAERQTQGLVGYQMLRRFNLTFDYRNNKVYMDHSKYGNETKFK